jgi:hypothetical protein
MISPTGKGIRGADAQGSGEYGAPRGGGKKHNGVDFVCKPGQGIVSPITGHVVREAKPYTDGPFSGLVIENDKIRIMMFYIQPDLNLIGKGEIEKGRLIGIAQNIAEKYPGITPHIHLRIERIDPTLLLDMP